MRIRLGGKEIIIFCDAYVDQGKHIGGDPIGYKCSERAVTKNQEGYDLCNWCAAHPERTGFVPYKKER